MKEFDLYEPMGKWLNEYLKIKYKNYEIIVKDTHSITLDKALRSLGIENNLAVGLGIQIDVLGVAKKDNKVKLFFIEAKITPLTLRDLGQLWAYCKLIDPEEAFLLSSNSFGTLNKIFNVLAREDLLDFGSAKKIKKMKIGIWDVNSNSPNSLTMIPHV